jgi:hypothetical protein
LAAELGSRGVSIIALATAGFVLKYVEARASEEAVDRATQQALAPDVRPDRGGTQTALSAREPGVNIHPEIAWAETA